MWGGRRGLATIGQFAKQWFGKLPGAVVVIRSPRSALGASGWKLWRDTGIRDEGTTVDAGTIFSGGRARNIVGADKYRGSVVDSWVLSHGEVAKAGSRLLMVSTTGEHYAYFELYR